jgi:hypothetical protein
VLYDRSVAIDYDLQIRSIWERGWCDLSWAILVRKLVVAVDGVDGLAQVARKSVGGEF